MKLLGFSNLSNLFLLGLIKLNLDHQISLDWISQLVVAVINVDAYLFCFLKPDLTVFSGCIMPHDGMKTKLGSRDQRFPNQQERYFSAMLFMEVFPYSYLTYRIMIHDSQTTTDFEYAQLNSLLSWTCF